MKTYILTEENIEKLRGEFCISKLQSNTFDEMLREFGCVSHSEHSELIIKAEIPGNISQIISTRKDS